MNENVTSHPLYRPLMDAIQQAMYGKGERHGGATVPFLEQPIFHYAKMHGRGFLTGQAAKKLEEAAHQREGQKFVDEVLGAIVYAAAAIIDERRRMEREKADAAKVPALAEPPWRPTLRDAMLDSTLAGDAVQRQNPDLYMGGKRALYERAADQEQYRTGLCTCGTDSEYHDISCGSLSVDTKRSKGR